MKKFIPPTIEEVAQYIRENPIHRGVDPVRFVNFYASKGWMVGKNKMVCWKSAVATWSRPIPKSGNLAPVNYPKPKPVQYCKVHPGTRLSLEGVCPKCVESVEYKKPEFMRR